MDRNAEQLSLSPSSTATDNPVVVAGSLSPAKQAAAPYTGGVVASPYPQPVAMTGQPGSGAYVYAAQVAAAQPQPRHFGGYVSGGAQPPAPNRSAQLQAGVQPQSARVPIAIPRAASGAAFSQAVPDHLQKRWVKEFLELNGFFNVNSERRSMGRIAYPIHVAVKEKNASMVRMLLAEGADPNRTTTRGYTAEDIAKSRNSDGSYNEILMILRSGQPATAGRVRAQAVA